MTKFFTYSFYIYSAVLNSFSFSFFGITPKKFVKNVRNGVKKIVKMNDWVINKRQRLAHFSLF